MTRNSYSTTTSESVGTLQSTFLEESLPGPNGVNPGLVPAMVESNGTIFHPLYSRSHRVSLCYFYRGAAHRHRLADLRSEGRWLSERVQSEALWLHRSRPGRSAVRSLVLRSRRDAQRRRREVHERHHR